MTNYRPHPNPLLQVREQTPSPSRGRERVGSGYKNLKKVKMRKIKYQNWVYEILTETDSPEEKISPVRADSELGQQVKQALTKLSEKEKIFIEEFYYQGRSYKEISRILKINPRQAEYLHRRATFKLKNLLADFVARRFKIKVDKVTLKKSVTDLKSGMVCVICQNPKQKEIEKIIGSKKEHQTWRVILKKLKQKFNLEIKAPQVLIGHMKH